MRLSALIFVLCILPGGLTLAAGAAVPEPRCESWQTGYRGSDASGPHVIGCWQFNPGAETKDSSSHGHILKLAGAVASPKGKFGGALESFPGWPVADKRHAAMVAPPSPALSPKGAFTAEMWIKPKPELTAELSPVLLDKKYAGNSDYQWRLSAAAKDGARRMQVALGFGEDSETFVSDAFQAGQEWQHVAFTYDGAGEVRFFRNGTPLGMVRKPGRGAVVPGKLALSIGDRAGSYYAGFPGFIDEVRLCEGVLEFRPLAVALTTARHTLLRMEKAPPVTMTVRNLTRSAARQLRLRVSLDGRSPKEFAVPELPAGAAYEASYAIDTSLRPDAYRLTARVELPGEAPYAAEETLDLVIAPRPLAKMPVLMWGIYSPESVTQELARLKDLGFTHCLGGSATNFAEVWKAGKPIVAGNEENVAATGRMLDLALANDFGIAFTLSPSQWLKERKELQRVDRQGKPYSPRGDVNAALPGLAEFAYNVGASVARTYDKFPAWQAALIDTEVRDSTQISFSPFDRDAYRKFSGREIPAEAVGKNGVKWSALKDFPADRIIPDDHPILAFYRWFWSVGDGWNALHSAVHRGIHSTGRADVWTWFDPAIRAPSLGGSGGTVDVLGQWTYTNPDPLRIGLFTDELLAMAAGSPQRPRVMKMTQLFWYRSQTAPKQTSAEHIASPFDDHDPDAAYITISPMHLRESFWTKLARPVSGIMYHGWQALVPSDGTSSYRYTHPDTKEEFRRLHRGVLEPLGPALLQAGERPADVAYLDSFTAQMFARRGGYGYSGDEAYLTLLYAHLQPEVLYEDQVLKDGLNGRKVLVLADCDVLPAGVARRIREFQQRGGLVIGDPDLAPGIKADITLGRVTRQKQAAADKAALLANAARLRAALDAKYARAVDCSNPEIVPRLRTAGAGDYIFVVNDHREPGDYVGQHGLTMDNGLPSSGVLTLALADGHVYDLVAGRAVPAVAREGHLRWEVRLGPCDGRVYLVTPQPIAAIRLTVPDSAKRGGTLPVRLAVTDPAGQPVDTVVPVRVEISDPAGRAAEFSGYYGARNGVLDLRLDMAANETPGLWQIRARELASDCEATVYCRVMPGPAPRLP